MSVDSDHGQLDSDRPKPLFEAANTNAPRGVVTTELWSLLIPIGLPMISVFSTCERRKKGSRNRSDLQPVLEHVVINNTTNNNNNRNDNNNSAHLQS
jgi:hypothetical protein